MFCVSCDLSLSLTHKHANNRLDLMCMDLVSFSISLGNLTGVFKALHKRLIMIFNGKCCNDQTILNFENFIYSPLRSPLII
jgi:hypothetical protein